MTTTIVIDSTSSLPEEYPGDLPLIVVPAILNWRGKSFKDGIDMTAQAFYDRLVIDSQHPTTSQVPPAEFSAVYERLYEAGSDILAMTLSSELSGTYQSALLAKADTPEARIEVIDSRTSGMALGWAAIAAAKASERGAGLEECRQIAEKALAHTGVVGMVNTLKYLHRAGRIGGASRFLGAALNLKPILEVSEGIIDGVDRVRTRKKAIARMLDLLEERIAGRTPVRLGIMHANDLPTAERIAEMSRDRFNPVETVVSVFSPILGANFGDGTIGVCFLAGMDT